MADQVKPDPNQAPTQDAQLAAENISTGQEKAPTVDVDADYEASKQFSVSDIDRSGEGEAAAEAATKPHFQVSQPEETTTETPSTGNPDDYRQMAKDASSKTEAGSDTPDTSDDVVKKALEKGQPGSSG